MPNKKVIFIKLGGSIITNKEIPMTLRRDVLQRLVKEIVQAQREQPETLFVVGHGSGSFGHVPALKYKTMEGFVHPESKMGMAIVTDTAAQLNRIVVQEFLRAGVPAVSFAPSQTLMTHGRVVETAFLDIFEKQIEMGLFPVAYGDVLVDTAQGCTVFSTEEVLSFLAQHLKKKGWPVSEILHIAEVDGVYDAQGQIIDFISQSNLDEVKSAITETKGFDVTGGMLIKVTQSIQMSKEGITSRILSGLRKENLYNALSGKAWLGTTIE